MIDMRNTRPPSSKNFQRSFRGAILESYPSTFGGDTTQNALRLCELLDDHGKKVENVDQPSAATFDDITKYIT